ncbi:glycosyltransferase [Paenibacillus sp. MMS18-CY102]|uniref:glycosyltransferase n=1 Tax=Paenibacillus sp. MMS18-CY102 TaxID=2682849 RepID=UPI0013663F53|nr:glycosyltransferase [Paenibacillus sp. MMS18-CY102]MWC27303.1 glycosyltransferase [Paenibacillus sp. MMS18-CY102]
MGIKLLLKKSYATVRYEGVPSLVRKTVQYTKRKIKNGKIESKSYKDILFINGCMLPHPSRYRVDHQLEQLHFSGYSCDQVYFESLTLEMVKRYRGFVFFRCPHTEVVEQFIHRAKYFNKKVFYDIDDLVIDEKYVSQVKYLKTMDQRQYDLYMDGVNRMRKTLELCDIGITTTTRLAEELGHYVPEVFINRNVASERMVELSQEALKNQENDADKIILGYFSGSITHNDDFKLIMPVVQKLLASRKNVCLKVVGILDIPTELEPYRNQIITEPFADWTKLPSIIASVDINLAPIEDTIFNEAKSENKWMEAALVKVPTVASNVGAFKEVIRNNVNGILCDDVNDWESELTRLLDNPEERTRLAEQAFQHVMEHYTTSCTSNGLTSFIETHLNDNIAFILPSTEISGGVNVVVKHCQILRKAGLDVTIISMGDNPDNIVTGEGEINVVVHGQVAIHAYLRKCVATLWTTVAFLNSYPKIKEKYYLVQGFETDFYSYGDFRRIWANLTYNSYNGLKYVTISKWCEGWLKTKYGQQPQYARNGINLTQFPVVPRQYENGKIRILIEGNSDDRYKNVDESFEIVSKLDLNKYEIWYMSYQGKPKANYHVDKFLHKIPYEQVGAVYGQCHILLKSSILESFSYPPLEMMATGGIVVAARNHGNVEFIVHEHNGMIYEQGDVDNAVKHIERVSADEQLRGHLQQAGLETARSRNWDRIETDVLNIYNVVPNTKNGEPNEYEIQMA